MVDPSPAPTPPEVPSAPPPVAADPAASRPRPARPRFSVPWRARLVHAFTTSPAYGAAVLLHALLLLALSLWTLMVIVKDEPAAVGVRLARATEVDTGDPAPVREQLDSLLEAPELPDSAASDAPALDAALGRTAGAALVDAPVPFGLLLTGPSGSGDAGGEGKGKAGGGRRSGASKQSDGARDAALDWLMRHRARQGAWGAVPQESREHAGLDDPTVAHTGLALLCYLCAGHAPGADGPYREVVERAEAWLVAQVDQDGVFKDARREWERHYHQAIGTLALAESLQRRRTPALEQAVKRLVGYLERARGRWGWRYSPRQDADTSVNGWVVLALKSAEHAQVKVEPKSFEVVREFLDRTTSEDGTTGYTTRRDPKDSMTATGLFLRIMLGEDPNTRRNRAASRLVARMRRFDEYDFGLYGLYYAALALYQVGGAQWEEWNPQVRDRLVRGMNDRKGACEHGSWQPIGFMNDLCLSTAMATLILQTYYRYLPVHAGIEGEPVEPEEPPPPPPSQGQLALDEAARALLDARRTRDPGALLVAEASYERAVGLLADDPELAREVRARLVEVAELSRDGDRALARAEEYLAALPPGSAPDRAVLRVRRRERHRQIALRAERLATLAGPAQAEESRRLAVDARALAGEIEGELRRFEAEEEERGEGERMTAALRQVAGALELQGGDEAGLAAVLAEVERGPANGVPSELETRALVALLGRASSGYEWAARGDEDGWERGERDRTRLLARRPLERFLGETRTAFASRLEALELVRLGGLLGLGREAEVLTELSLLAARWPEATCASERRALERTALARRVEGGKATPPERERFGQLLCAWSRENPRLAAPERVALGQRLLALGDAGEAARQLEMAAARPAELPGDLLRQAHLELARARRLLGDPAAALAVLEALPPATRKDLAVRLERCLALRAAGDPGTALDEYLKLLRALGDGRPPEWWAVTEEAAQAWVELGRADEARQMLDAARRLDPTFGGDDARRDRFVRLMHELDRIR